MVCASLLHAGDAPPIEEDERFAATCSSFNTLLTSRASVYESEEHALRVLMKEEVMEKMERSKRQAGEAMNWGGGRVLDDGLGRG